MVSPIRTGAQHANPHLPRAIIAYIGGVCVAALTLLLGALLLTSHPFTGTWPLAVALVFLTLGAARTNIDLYGRGQITPSAAALVASALILGPAGGGLLAAIAGMLVGHRGRHLPWHRRAFNVASFAIPGLLLGVAAGPLLGVGQALLALGDATLRPMGLASPLLLALPLGLLLGGALCTINITLLAAAMGISEHLPVRVVYRERLAWLVPHTLAYAVIGTGMGLAGMQQGVLALVFFSVPMFLIRQVGAQIIAGTREHVASLQSTREHLEQALAVVQENEQMLTAMVGELQREQEETIRAFSGMLDARDRETEGHSERVVGYALALARALELDEALLPNLELGALLHDIGKVGIPDAILLKPGPLTQDEWTIMRQHPLIGTKLVHDNVNLCHAIPVIRHHHERFDGTGYPDGLAGAAIPLVARIFSIADVYDALVSDRPYRPGMPVAEAVRIIREGNGRQFDPDVVAAFERLIDVGALPPPNLDNTARSDGLYTVTSTKPLLASVGSALVHMTASALAESRRA